MASITLDDRLSTIAALIGSCESVADIGADHGRLGAFLLQSGQARRVQFLDVSADSLLKARRLIGKLGLSDKALFSVGDGANAMLESADVCVIAGMGGQLIAQIVEAGQAQLGDARLIMQPNMAAPELRERLSKAGYRIARERIVRAANRLYVVMDAVRGESHYDPRQLLVGPCLLEHGSPLLAPYAQWRLRIAAKALLGAEQGDAPWKAALELERDTWEGILNGGEGWADL